MKLKSLNRWVYAIFGVIALLMAGMVYAWSVMSQAIGASRPDWTAQRLSLTFTLVMVFFCIGVLIAGILAKRIAPRIYLIISAVLFVLGFFVASRTGQSPAMLYLGFGVLCGLGSGFTYNAIMSTLSAWFPDKQGLISGILLMGFGLSSFIIGNIYNAMTPIDGSDTWQRTFLIFGIVIAIILIICCIFIVRPGPDYNPGKGDVTKKAVREPASEMNAGQMLRRPSFWFYYIWAIFISAAGLALVSQASGIATEVGTQVLPGVIATVVGLISIFNGVGRVIFGALYDRLGHRVTLILDIVLFFIATLILMFAIRSGSFALIILGFVVGGLAYGGVTPTNSALISDFFGRKNYPVNFSIINTNLLIASFASTIAGRLYDSSQTYMTTIYMMFIVIAVGLIAFFGVRRPKPEDAAKAAKATAAKEAAAAAESADSVEAAQAAPADAVEAAETAAADIAEDAEKTE